MRKETEVYELILKTAAEDDRIRAVLLSGSRANSAAPKDIFQDYDITYFVTDITPFYNKPDWIAKKFGKPLIMQMPETMRFPEGDGNFNYLIIFEDGVRIDLSFVFTKYTDDGEPAVMLLDKDNGSRFLPAKLPSSDKKWHIKPPDEHFYLSCCNEFWWCLNNAAKGIARGELPYVMYMLNEIIRPELHYMIGWFIGVENGFNFSVGKNCKYIKHYLPEDLYNQYRKTYSGADYAEIWNSIYAMCGLFHNLALQVAGHFGFTYNQNEEDGMMKYLEMVKHESAD
ncbi:MAG: aminoglycoside 6-adenylyltransferase [Treponema sp.]|nr:aminoglycoside 6-adenylyltransferase [Treponema sp.]